MIKTKLDKNEKITKELSTEWANDWFSFADTDGDGIPNRLDLDPDGDGDLDV